MSEVEIELPAIKYRMVLPDADTDYIQRGIRDNRAPYERSMLEDMASRLPEGGLVVDVGANVGNHTLYLAASGARVVAYEPNAELADAISSSVRLNGFAETIEIRCLGVGARAGQGGFETLNAANLGAQRLREGDGDLPIVALDAETFPGSVALLKIDVEGGELDVLHGAHTLISQDRPAIYVECAQEIEFERVSRWMEQAGYLVWDTWNGTPTHLFLPCENLSLERKVARLNAMLTKTQVYGSQRRLISAQKLLQKLNKSLLASFKRN